MSAAVLDRGQRVTHRWHPATELVVLTCSLLLVFGVSSPLVSLVIIIASAIAAMKSTAVGVRPWLMGVGIICGPTLIIVGIVQGLFYPGSEVSVLWELGPARLSVEGLLVAVQVWLRVTALVSLCALFGLGTDSARMFDGLRRLRLPAAVAYICASAIGLIPLIRMRTQQIVATRASRGWETGRWSVRIRLLPGLLTGLFTAVLVEAEQRHEVLEQRGLGQAAQSTELQDHHEDDVQGLIRRGAPALTIVLIVLSLLGLLPLPSAEQLIGGL